MSRKAAYSVISAALALLPLTLLAAPDIAITHADEFYSQNAFVVSTGVDPNAVLDHRLDGDGVKWGFGSGSPVPFFSVQYPGPDDCMIGESYTVRVQHRAYLDGAADQVTNSLNYTCDDVPL